MSLIKEFLGNKKRYLQHKHQYSTKSEKDRQSKVIRFLKFCELQGIDKIKNITQRELDMFVEKELSNKSTETKRKYLLAVLGFSKRAHLPIAINIPKSINRTKQNKLLKLAKILGLDINEISSDQQAQILRLL